MKPELVKVVLVTVGAVLFNIIFWQQKMALNAVLFDVFIISSVFYLYPVAFKQSVIKWLLSAHIITAAAVVLHNTILSKVAFSATLLLVVVFIQYLHRSVWYAAGSAVLNYVLMIPSFFNNLQQLRPAKFNFFSAKKVIRFLIIPILFLLLFFGLYNFANSIFNTIITDIAAAVQQFFARFFDWFSWQRYWFLLLGLFITGGLLLKSKVLYFVKADSSKSTSLARKKNNLNKWRQTSWFQLLSLLMGRFASGSMALRNENTTGIISLVLLNILLLFINCIDVVYVWFGFKYNNDLNLSQYVHEGTGMLIFSIILAMVLVLFFFRGNLNFYKKNKWLRLGAYAWLVQNMVLVVSVFFRDYYYIVNKGLAYKRIGVLVFLLLVLIGLVTVFIKIQQVKTAYYLLRINAFFAMAILVICACVHWDEMIAEYNLARKNIIPLDIHFLLTLSDKTLPILEANKEIFDTTASQILSWESDFSDHSVLSLKEVFERRKKAFFVEQKYYNWLSWNYADDFTNKYLLKEILTVNIQH